MMKFLAMALAPIMLAGCVTENAKQTSDTNAAEAAADQAQTAETTAQMEALELARTVPTMSAQAVKEGYVRNASLAQLYRWYQFYENDDAVLANQLDILATDVSVISGLGEANGHDEYSARVTQIPSEWDNAHIVKSTDITTNDDGSISMIVNITYLNQGLMEDGTVRMADLTYDAVLEATDSLLPVFANISIGQNEVGTANEFVSEYEANRLKSVLHYWLAIIEDPKRDAAPVREILAEDFVLNFSSGPITSYEGYEAWLKGPGSQVSASTHSVTDFDFEQLGEGIYRMNATLDWQGILPNGNEMVARTRHTWTVEDDPSERFARIKTVDVDLLVPFSAKP